MEKTAIVILNWNGRKYLEKFLPDIIRYSEGASVIVADNHSSDDSVNFLEKNFPEVRIIRIAQNEGYSKGYNTALKKVKAEYYVLLNSDVQVTEGWLSPLINTLEQNPSVAACQPKLLSYAEQNKFEYAGAAGGFIDSFGYPFCRGRIFNTLEEDKGQYNDDIDIFWASGACLAIKSNIFHQAGGFDEDFFAHMEEIDLCWRLQCYGLKVRYCAASTIYHVGGGTLNQGNPFKTYLNFRNNLALLIKNLPTYQLIPIFIIRLYLDGIAGVKFLFTDSFQHCWAVVKAHFYIYGHLPMLLKKRRAVRFLAQNEPTMKYKGLIIWDYFAKGKKNFNQLKF